MKLVIALLSALSIATLGSLIAGAQPGQQPGTPEALKAALEEAGFIVQEGQLETVDVIGLCCSGMLPSCYANNAGAPYMLYRIPLAPGQDVQNAQPWSYRLRPDEAIILVGRTPPDIVYFSYQTFATNRFFAEEGARRRIYACIGDAVNNMSLHAEFAGSSPFRQPFLLVSTADRGIDARIRAAAVTSGYPAGAVITDAIPSAILRLGLDYESDELSLLHRMALPSDPEALAAYLQAPQVVLRVTPAEPASLDPFPTPALRVRGTGTTEMDLMPAVEELRGAILAEYPDLDATELTTSVWLEDGFDGLQRGIDRYGPTRDALYLWTQPFFQLLDDPDSFVIVYGVDHAATGKATYASASLYADPGALFMGISGVTTESWAGTGERYLPDHPQAHLLYAYRISRRCDGGANCLEVRLEGCQGLSLDSLPDLWICFRAYLEPATLVGPAFAEIVYDRAIVFGPPE